MVDLNGWVRDRVRVGITGPFGAPGENENGRTVVDFCLERWLWVGDTYFAHTNFKNTPGWIDRVEVVSMIDVVLLKKDMLRYEHDVMVIKGM